MALFGSKVKGSFFFDLPKDWQDQTVYSFMGPEENGVQHILIMTVDRYPQSDNIDDYAISRISPMEGKFPGMEVLVDEEKTVNEDVPLYEYTFSWLPGGDLKFVEKYIFAFKEGCAFTFYIKFEKNTHKTVGNSIPKVIEAILPGTFKA